MWTTYPEKRLTSPPFECPLGSYVPRDRQSSNYTGPSHTFRKGQFADWLIQGNSRSGWNHQDTNVRKVKTTGTAYLRTGSPTEHEA